MTTRAVDPGQRRRAPLVQGDIEDGILTALEDLEHLTEQYAELGDAAAEAENAYKGAKHSALVTIARRGDKMTDALRLATVENDCAPLADAARLSEARLRSCREAMTTKRTRIDALRSLSANVRAQT